MNAAHICCSSFSPAAKAAGVSATGSSASYSSLPALPGCLTTVAMAPASFCTMGCGTFAGASTEVAG